MNSLDEVLQYRRRVDDARQRVAKAEGRLESAMEQLSHGYGCGTVQAGRLALKELQRKRDKAEEVAKKRLKAFEQKWKEHLC
jgi:recombinational DNA repair protein RecR